MPRLLRNVAVRKPKKEKQVTGNAMKLKKLTELKKVNKEIDKLQKQGFAKTEKMFAKRMKLQEQLGIS